jgi:hypothetical protein
MHLPQLTIEQSEHPGNFLTGDWHAHGHGQLGEVDFKDGWNGDVSKSFADPDFVSHSEVHKFSPADMVTRCFALVDI